MRGWRLRFAGLLLFAVWPLWPWWLGVAVVLAADTTPSGLPELQDQQPFGSYDFDQPPGGLFRSIVTAEGFEEELGFRRTHEIVPVNPTEVFRPDTPAVFVVFRTHQHYQSFQVFGLCYPEQVEGLDPKALLAQDTMFLATEDESGYVKLLAPPGGWKPGRYRVEIHVGFEVNDLSLMGTMRFSVKAPS